MPRNAENLLGFQMFFVCIVDAAKQHDSTNRALREEISRHDVSALSQQGLLHQVWAILEPHANGGPPMERDDWTRVLSIPALREWIISSPHPMGTFQNLIRADVAEELAKAYEVPFQSDAREAFVQELYAIDKGLLTDEKAKIYGRCVSIINSSGVGKSRLAGQLGIGRVEDPISTNEPCRPEEPLLAIPVNLRGANAPGWPPGDDAVRSYFEDSSRNDSGSASGHVRCAAFLGAALSQALGSLKDIVKSNPTIGYVELIRTWTERMEGRDRTYRNEFWKRVIAAIHESSPVTKSSRSSPKRKDPQDEEYNKTIVTIASDCHAEFITKPRNDLLAYLQEKRGQRVQVIIYFDESAMLDEFYWILLRLTNRQPQEAPLWLMFMATNGRIKDYMPPSQDINSARLFNETMQLIDPWYYLGWDHWSQLASKSRTMMALLSWLHASYYGRPIWYAHKNSNPYHDILEQGTLKLFCGVKFDPHNIDAVFAAFSVIVILDLVLHTEVAATMAERAVASHMRLFDGVERFPELAYQTHTPGEPVLALCAAYNLFESVDTFSTAFRTLVAQLAQGNLIPKGDIGELAARLLLYCPRIVAANWPDSGREPPKYVGMIVWLEALLGPKLDDKLRKQFAGHHINFTHWLATKEAIPWASLTRKQLANWWARGCALQCCPNQESFDALVVSYTSSVEDNAIFDPELVCLNYIQVKFKHDPDYKAIDKMHATSMAIQPELSNQPHLGILMELGTEARFQDNNLFVRMTEPGLRSTRTISTKSKPGKNSIGTSSAVLGDGQMWTIEIRGNTAETYSILNHLRIADTFRTMLKCFEPSVMPRSERTRPCYRFTGPSVEWMADYERDSFSQGQSVADVEMDDG
ncbi:hypothetical protein DACRYDRAFT_21854 [Dacryopinax primogenitus]|uniref:Uncharacterized protein n=1 Tax=Dacryopinax primogenitus (strain DJM 731) TaxID=1858805 RepID=M5GCZ7_DACPD|nr:uncharacterized protein DACRYDRAFT_21854 [Dacryopinax primogenitus]EJU02063.1 hypothetical protein DACRYDRAFT_21854 [Dacryopinax primogenitus]